MKNLLDRRGHLGADVVAYADQRHKGKLGQILFSRHRPARHRDGQNAHRLAGHRALLSSHLHGVEGLKFSVGVHKVLAERKYFFGRALDEGAFFAKHGHGRAVFRTYARGRKFIGAVEGQRAYLRVIFALEGKGQNAFEKRAVGGVSAQHLTRGDGACRIEHGRKPQQLAHGFAAGLRVAAYLPPAFYNPHRLQLALGQRTRLIGK